MAVCMVLAAFPTGSMHGTVSGNGLHAKLFQNLSSVVFTWHPSAPKPKLHQVGLYECQIEQCLWAERVTDPL